jgi:hypothetical protein
MYDELGWELPEGGAKLKQPATPRKKRAAESVEGETPKKKARGGKGKAKEEEEKESSGEEDKVKEEEVELDDV